MNVMELVVPDDDLDHVTDIIRVSARTGTKSEIGDGKIIALPVAETIAI